MLLYWGITCMLLDISCPR